jgi:hypothetical protein
VGWLWPAPAVPAAPTRPKKSGGEPIKLSDLCLRVKEKFLYEYDFIDQWRHLIRVEAILPSEADQRYPVCISGKRAAPPEDCGGPWAFMQRRDEAPCEFWERFWRLEAVGEHQVVPVAWKCV